MRALLLFFLTLELHAGPPGVAINHSPAESGRYIGSPSIVILPNGSYLASHDFFGPKSAEFEAPETLVFASNDRGASWRRVAGLQSLFWAGLFVHRGEVYILGTDRHNGRIVIRRSRDNCVSWSEPSDGRSGLLTSRAEYHTAPTPVVEHDRKLWRAFEDVSRRPRGVRFMPVMLSVPVEADLLNATNWTISAPFETSAPHVWLEGNAVVTPQKAIANVLRVDVPKLPEKAAILTFHSASGTLSKAEMIDFPGGSKKFTIRFDSESNAYWSLASAVPERTDTLTKPSNIRNTLVLLKSTNLRNWEIRARVLQHPDVQRHGFQYVDWQFDGRDMIAAVRTAWDDERGGAKSAHDANYLTFHRFSDFRSIR